MCGLLLFADPVADIAVLGSPVDQDMYEEAEAYDKFVEPLQAIAIGAAQTGEGWLLSLDKPYRWVPTTLDTEFGSLFTGHVSAGQSGSPILNREGQAVGIVSIGGSMGQQKKGSCPAKTTGHNRCQCAICRHGS